MMRPSVLAGVGAAVLALPAVAQADGTSVLTLKARALPGVTVVAVAPAKAKGKAITFPVSGATVGATATLSHGGGLRLRAGRRSVTLSAPKLRLGATSRLTAALGRSTVSVLAVDGAARRLDAGAGAVALKGATVRLTVAGAAALRRALGLRWLAAGTIGTLTVSARSATAAPAAPSAPTAPMTPGTPTVPTTPTVPAAPPVEPGPTPLARPATAVDVSASSITWHVRDSFIQYINTGEGTSVSGGATAEAPSVQPGSSAPLVYAFRFPFKDGWYDPMSQTARITYTGMVTFGYRAHGIKLTATDPEVELSGATSRAIFKTANAPDAPKRGVLETLDVAHAAGIAHDPDGTHAWTQVPGRIPADAGASVFAGYYAAGDPFGWISVEATA